MIRTILTINDENLSILVFNIINKKPIYLYEDYIKLNSEEIKKSYIVDNQKLSSKIKSLIDQAQNFVGCKINKIYLSYDINKIDICDFNTSINLTNKVLNDKVWKSLNEIKIKQENQKQILSLDTIKWNINGLNVYKLDKNYTNVDHVDIYGKVFQMNKTFYNNILDIFNNLNLEIIEFIPVIMNLNQLCKSNEINNYELVCYLNKNSLNLVLLQANHIIDIFSYDLGYDQLINEIAIAQAIDNEQLFNLFNDEYSLLFNCSKNLNLIIDYHNSFLDHNEIDLSNINKIIRQYTLKIDELINEKIKELKAKNINISFISLFVNNNISGYLFNIVKANLNIDNSLIELAHEANLDINQNFAILFVKNILNNHEYEFNELNINNNIQEHNYENKGA